MRDTAGHLRETDEVQQGKEDEETMQLLELNTVNDEIDDIKSS